ncbi:PIG-L family deacetylase [Candidatus Solirubrobacter pratensis]|uniref:PIG-L family deacetylase n=1 Tax=Candidatus Solirubrobacter pratensis TaxID=1298857 RepID=UPI0006860EF7|nr:PIG-L family deacetylase [Candidatus Solirubrobacter pratensis]
MKRFGCLVASMLALAAAAAPARAAQYTASSAVKINVMGEWAHPDDDTSIIGPCGVWHQRYGVRCGIIMVTRGEGGGNAVGSEIGPALGLRRENEDRVAHYRSGTVDIFNLDRVDFFYNQSAPLTQYFWNHDETLRRVVRIIRMTQPDVYIGFTPTLGAGHGNHQQAGRFIWEGMLAAADPNMFPEQLTGPHALSTWQVKKVFSGGATAGAGGTTTAAGCTTGFSPSGLDTVAGVWTGYDSPFAWPAGNVQGKTGAKSWAQVAAEGSSAYPTQSRVMSMRAAAPACSRFGMTDSFVPFQPNGSPDAGKDDAILDGAVKPDPGGLPLGTLEYLTFSRFYNAPGAPFIATLHVKSGSGTLPAGTVALTVPAGWTVGAPKAIGPTPAGSESTATFTVTPSATAAVNTNFKVSALLSSGSATGYTDDVVRVVSPVEGRFHRWGNWAEYDSWLEQTAPAARRLGRSAAIQTVSAGETITVPVDVHNWSTTSQSGTVSLTPPSGVTADALSKPYGPLAPGADATVDFRVSNSFTNSTLPITGAPASSQSTNVNVRITTSYDGGSGFEDLTLGIVPKTMVPEAAAAPSVDGVESPGEYTGEALDIGRKWEPGGTTRDCSPAGVDCGSSGAPGSPTSTYAKVTWRDDALYFFVHVRDEYQSYAVKPEECVAHWLADSVEILIDPRGNASQVLKDTANTFKLGIFPFTNDPSGSNGNGADGPCWERDADNHQGYSTGPLAATVDGAPNAPGVVVKSTAAWVGSNDTGVDHSYGATGGYDLEVKIPMADLPAAVDPANMGLNITPYDEDNTAAAGTTTLRHIDQSTRLAWSTFGSVQSDPYRWGRAVLSGYTPPAGRSTTPDAPNVSHPNLDGVDSPQTIAQSARNGVPISGRTPASGVSVSKVVLTPGVFKAEIDAPSAGTAHVFLWKGEKGYIPVFKTSCTPAADPPPDFGLTACALTDGSIPAWSPDMGGHVVRDLKVGVKAGHNAVTIPLDRAAFDRLAGGDGSALVSYESGSDEVAAFDVPLKATSSDRSAGGTAGHTTP